MTENPYASPELGPPSEHSGIAGSPFSVVSDGQGKFQFDHDMRLEDVIDFNLHNIAHAPYFKRQLRRAAASAVLIVACILFFVLIANLEPATKLRAAVVILFGAIVTAAIFPWVRRRSMAATVRGLIDQNSEMLGVRRTTIDAEGVRELKRYSESLTRWPAVERIETSERNVFIYTSDLTCVLIPKLAFANQEQLDSFLAAAREYLEAGHAARKRDRNVLGD